MKALHLAVAAAILLVVALVAFLLATDGGRGGTRRASEREAAGTREATPAKPRDAGTTAEPARSDPR